MSDTTKTDDSTSTDALADAVKEAGKAVVPPSDGKGAEGKADEGTAAPAEKAAPASDEAPKPLLKEDGKPFTAADLEALQTALKAARTDARTAKGEATAAKGAVPDPDTIRAEAETAAAGKYKPLMVKAAARAAFAEAGLTLPKDRHDEAFARAVRLLDVEALTITDDGLVEGLADQVEAIRGDFPDLFAGAARRPAARHVNAADRPAGVKPPASAAERLAAQLIG